MQVCVKAMIVISHGQGVNAKRTFLLYVSPKDKINLELWYIQKLIVLFDYLKLVLTHRCLDSQI